MGQEYSDSATLVRMRLIYKHDAPASVFRRKSLTRLRFVLVYPGKWRCPNTVGKNI